MSIDAGQDGNKKCCPFTPDFCIFSPSVGKNMTFGASMKPGSCFTDL